MPENPFVTTDAELKELGVRSRSSWESIYPIYNFVPRSDGFPYLPGVGAIGPLNMNNQDFCRAKVCDYLFFPDDVEARFGNKAKDHNAHIVLDGTDWIFRSRVSDTAKLLFNATGTDFSPLDVFHFRGTPAANTDPLMNLERSHSLSSGAMEHTEFKSLNTAAAVGAFSFNLKFKHEDSGGEFTGSNIQPQFNTNTSTGSLVISCFAGVTENQAVKCFSNGEVGIGKDGIATVEGVLMVGDGTNSVTIQLRNSPSRIACEVASITQKLFIRSSDLEFECNKMILDGNFQNPAVAKGFADGSNDDVSLSEALIQRITGPTANFEVTGMVTSESVNANGDIIILENSTLFTMEIKNQDALSAAANRFLTPSGGDLVFAAGSCVQFIYDSTTARWRMMESESTVGSVVGSSLSDLDGDTTITLEASADEDIIRMDVAGTERFVLQDTGTHLTITGDSYLNGHMAIGADAAISANIIIDVDETQVADSGLQGIVLEVDTTGAKTVISLEGINIKAEAAHSSGFVATHGIFGQASVTGAGDSGEVIGVIGRAEFSGSGTVNSFKLFTGTVGYAGASGVINGTSAGLQLPNMGHAVVTGSSYGIRLIAQSGSTGPTWAIASEGGASYHVGQLTLFKSATLPVTNTDLDMWTSGIALGADVGTNLRTDITAKRARIVAAHSTNAEEPVVMMSAQSLVDNNSILIGGGDTDFNASTLIEFYVAPNITTKSGTLSARILKEQVLFADGTPSNPSLGFITALTTGFFKDVNVVGYSLVTTHLMNFTAFGSSIIQAKDRAMTIHTSRLTNGAGDNVILLGGNALSGNLNGGDIQLAPGLKTGSGVDGQVEFTNNARSIIFMQVQNDGKVFIAPSIGATSTLVRFDVDSKTTNEQTGNFSRDVTAASTPVLGVVQDHLTGAQVCLSLDQDDISEGFIDFVGSARGVITSATSSLQSARVELNGTKYRIALYVDA